MNDTMTEIDNNSSGEIAGKIKLERARRAWTQEKLADECGLSVRTVQRIECGEAPSAETLRLIAKALDVPVSEMGRCPGRNVFRSPYFTQKWRYFALAFSVTAMAFLLVFVIAKWSIFPLWFKIFEPAFFASFLSSLLFGYVTGLSVSDGKLHIHHLGWAKKIDLSKLTGVEICPEMLGAFPLAFFIGWNMSAPWYAASLGIFRNYGSNTDTGVILEFGKKKIVVTPDDRDAFVEAIYRAIEGTDAVAGSGLLRYASRIRAERRKQSWTQEKLAEVTGLSVRTVQRLECGTQPSTDTLRLLATAFGLDVADFLAEAAKPAKTRFRATYSKSMKRTFTALAVVFIGLPFAAIFMEKVLGIDCHSSMGMYKWFMLLYIVNMFTMTNSFTIKGGKLVIQHFLLKKSYDLSRLTNIDICPHAMMGSIPLSFPVVTMSAWYRNALLGTYRAFVTDPAHMVVMRFGKQTIVVSPDDPDAFVEAVRAQLRNAGTSNAAPAA
ncbi:MAG TPA: helix-turn-helix domain-containing protein [Opitutales bacterium]|nr:helix-turn-helix domain-containing protein [Opitutales bacterium]